MFLFCVFGCTAVPFVVSYLLILHAINTWSMQTNIHISSLFCCHWQNIWICYAYEAILEKAIYDYVFYFPLSTGLDTLWHSISFRPAAFLLFTESYPSHTPCYLFYLCGSAWLQIKADIWIPLLRMPLGSWSVLDAALSSLVQMEHRHRKKETATPASTHHLFVHMKSLMSANLGEELEVYFHIYDGRENRPLR